jgi:uncharacterized protein
VRRAVLLFLLLAAFSSSVLAQEAPVPPEPNRWVTDTSGFLDPQSADALDSRLRLYQEQTGHHLLVWIGKTTGDAPLEDWTNRVFEKWKVGRKGVDDGLVLFILTDDRKIRIEVGYGLEAQIPDLVAAKIISSIVTPGLRTGQPATTINRAMEAVADVLGMPLPGSAPRERVNRQRREVGIGQLILYGIIALIALVVFATNPSMATWLLLSMLSGGGRRGGGSGGGWGGGGGGYGGGGGHSGGGGASGSW